MITKKIIEAIEQKKYNDNIENTCCLCGISKCFEFKNRKKVLSASFTDFNTMACKDSNFVCGYCEKIVNNDYMPSPLEKTCGLRLYSFVVENNTFTIINKSEFENYLMHYQYNFPSIIIFSDSGKKH